MRVEDYTLAEKYNDKKTFILNIQHAYKITHVFRTIENFKNKLLDYKEYNIENIKESKDTLILDIKGKLNETKRLSIRIKEIKTKEY